MTEMTVLSYLMITHNSDIYTMMTDIVIQPSEQSIGLYIYRKENMDNSFVRIFMNLHSDVDLMH